MPNFFLTFFCLLLSLPVLLATSLNSGFNHRAHAVPGGPYRAPDVVTKLTTVFLDGRASHTHFFNPATGVVGRVVQFRWTVGAKLLCSTPTCFADFPLGKTIIKLYVKDSTGDESEATTTVNVFRAKRPKVRAVFSEYGEGQLIYSATKDTIAFDALTKFPHFLWKRRFLLTLHAGFDAPLSGMYVWALTCIPGPCEMYVGEGRVLAGKGTLLSKAVWYGEASYDLKIKYRREGDVQPALVLRWKPPGGVWHIVPVMRLWHVPHILAPVVNRIAPEKPRVGERIVIRGSALVGAREVRVGEGVCADVKVKNQYEISCIVPGGVGEKSVRVVTAGGWSNGRTIEVVQGWTRVGYYQPVKFEKGFVKKRTDSVWQGKQLTSIVMGGENWIYVGSLSGVVYGLRLDSRMVVREECVSRRVEGRSILGLGINLARRERVVYASTSVLVWKTKKLLDWEEGWRNGEVIEMGQTKEWCLEQTRVLISGLPVSNYDHGVNGLSFDSNGNLFISVAGTTNAGVSEVNDGLGGIPDSPLSGAILWAPIMRPDFNGTITYSRLDKPELAFQTGGDVYVHAPGVRNCFSHMLHSNGRLYATDNGGNQGFGKRSISCTNEMMMSKERDSLHLIHKHAFYGYANRNRGRWDAAQCQHHMGSHYRKGILELESSTNGIFEYTANTFGAQLRGNLILAKYAATGSGTTSRVALNKWGGVAHSGKLADLSGLTAIMGAGGEVLMPRFMQGHIAILKPIEEDPGILTVRAVTPFRGPKQGGNRVVVSGWGLWGAEVLFGGKGCGGVKYGGSRWVSCVVPPGEGKVSVVVRKGNEWSTSYGFEYWYMNV